MSDFRIPLRGLRLVWRAPEQDQNADGLLVGDIFESYDPPVYEIDPRTRQATGVLKRFKVTSADASGHAIRPDRGTGR